MFKKRFTALVLSMFLILPTCVLKASSLSESEISSPSAILIEPQSKKILFEKMRMNSARVHLSQR